MEFNLTNTMKRTLTAKFIDKNGKPAPVDGVPVWNTSQGGIVNLVPSADGMTCEVQGIPGVAGDVDITCSGDADLGDGVKPVVGSVTCHAAPPEATAVVIDVGDEQPL